MANTRTSQPGTPAAAALLRVLLVEDSEDDAELILREIRRGGRPLHVVRVMDAAGFEEALAREAWDAIVCDWSLPGFSARAALEIVQARGMDLPFIIVSGTVTEESAVDALHAGAHDFVTKGKLARLVPAIERERREAASRRESRALREQLILSERLSSIGLLAAGVAHEINNPLAAIISTLDYIADMCGASAVVTSKELEDPIRDAREAADRMRDIVQDLRMFSHVRRVASEPVDLRRVVESSARLARNQVRHRAQLEKELWPVPLVDGDDARLGQVFLNLLVNAAQAIPEGHAMNNEIRVVTRTADDGRAVVEVRDTGSGIPPEIAKRIFEPFFTTKPRGVGTGLGLAICRNIVDELGGELLLDTKPGTGSTFTVILPPSTANAGSRAPAAHPAAAPRGRVLMLDDEPVVGRSVARMLRGEHEVVVVTTGREALALIERGERYDAILCDVMMPELTGYEFYDLAVALDGTLARRFVFLTGGAFTPRAAEFLAHVGCPRVEKPFERATLREALASVLGAR
ncbi:MAG TPA: ATP-binding protein [Polyangiaceae bacterium]